MQPKFSALVIVSDDNDLITCIELWLERILLKFQNIEEERDMCKGEIL